MRSRSGSGVRLDRLMYLVEKTILSQQNPITGLFATDKKVFFGVMRDGTVFNEKAPDLIYADADSEMACDCYSC